jgi:hypothetical protein
LDELRVPREGALRPDRRADCRELFSILAEQGTSVGVGGPRGAGAISPTGTGR